MLDLGPSPPLAREIVTKNLRVGRPRVIEDTGVMHFVKHLRYQEQTRRYSIAATTAGWEVLEERDREVGRKEHYRDWHRGERARRATVVELNALRDRGGSEGN